jgi:hypothetical protein
MRKIVKLASISAGIVAGLAIAGYASAARDSSGTFTFGAVAGGYPIQPGVINRTAMNANLAEVAAALTDSASRSGAGGFTAPVRGADGTAAAPAYSWTNDTNTGFYRIGADDVGLSIGGTKLWEQTSAGMIESGTLQVTGLVTASGLQISTGVGGVSKNGGADMWVGTADAFDVVFMTSNVERVRLSSTGGMALNSNRITGVANPTAAQDAATKAYVDDSIQLIATTDAWHNVGAGGEPALTAPWTVDGAPSAVLRFRKVAGVVFVQGSISSGGNNADVFALPTGYRPNGDLYVVDGDTGLGGPGLTKVTAATGVLRTVGGASTRRSYNFSFPAD